MLLWLYIVGIKLLERNITLDIYTLSKKVALHVIEVYKGIIIILLRIFLALKSS